MNMFDENGWWNARWKYSMKRPNEISQWLMKTLDGNAWLQVFLKCLMKIPDENIK